MNRVLSYQLPNYQLLFWRCVVKKHELSEKELTDLQLQDVIERAEVSTPVLAYKVVGRRVELHLLGGPVAYVEADWLVEPSQLLDGLEEMTYDALYGLAQKLKVRGRSSMDSAALVEAIRKAVGSG
jgi:hypothetical protein